MDEMGTGWRGERRTMYINLSFLGKEENVGSTQIISVILLKVFPHCKFNAA